MTPIYLRSLQALEMAVKKRSFTGAAEALGITAAAVGQRVKALEDYLGVQLLVRGRAGIKPADALLVALPDLHRAFEALESATNELELQRQQDLHIAVSDDIFDLWLGPRLATFKTDNPQIALCINGEGNGSCRNTRVDCEITLGQKANQHFSDLLFCDYVLPVASPVNIERLSKVEPETRLEGFPIFHLDFYRDDPAELSWSNWLAVNNLKRSAADRGMRFQSVTAALDAVGADAGIALCGIALARRHLTDDRIGQLYPEATGLWAQHAVLATYPKETLTRPHIQRFRMWLQAQGDETAKWIQQFMKD